MFAQVRNYFYICSLKELRRMEIRINTFTSYKDSVESKETNLWAKAL